MAKKAPPMGAAISVPFIAEPLTIRSKTYLRRRCAVECREELRERRDFGSIDQRDVGVVRMQCRIILVIGFSRIERHRRGHLGHDRSIEGMRSSELPKIGVRNPALLSI